MSQTPPDSSPEGEQPTYLVRARRSRAPRYPVFIGTGVLVGVAVAVVLAFLRPEDPEFGRAKVVGYVGMSLGLVCGLLGGLAAVLLDKRR